MGHSKQPYSVFSLNMFSSRWPNGYFTSFPTLISQDLDTKWVPTARQSQKLPAQQIVFACLWVCEYMCVWGGVGVGMCILSLLLYQNYLPTSVFITSLMPFIRGILFKEVSTSGSLLSLSRPSNVCLKIGNSITHKWDSDFFPWFVDSIIIVCVHREANLW